MNLIAGSIVKISHKEMYVNTTFKEEHTFNADIYKPLLSQDNAYGHPNQLPESLAIEPISNHRKLRKDNSPEAVNKQEHVFLRKVISPFKMAAAA